MDKLWSPAPSCRASDQSRGTVSLLLPNTKAPQPPRDEAQLQNRCGVHLPLKAPPIISILDFCKSVAPVDDGRGSFLFHASNDINDQAGANHRKPDNPPTRSHISCLSGLHRVDPDALFCKAGRLALNRIIQRNWRGGCEASVIFAKSKLLLIRTFRIGFSIPYCLFTSRRASLRALRFSI